MWAPSPYLLAGCVGCVACLAHSLVLFGVCIYFITHLAHMLPDDVSAWQPGLAADVLAGCHILCADVQEEVAVGVAGGGGLGFVSTDWLASWWGACTTALGLLGVSVSSISCKYVGRIVGLWHVRHLNRESQVLSWRAGHSTLGSSTPCCSLHAQASIFSALHLL